MRDWLFLFVVGMLVVPLQTLLVPVLRMSNITGLSGTYLGIWLVQVGLGLPLGIFLLRNFFAALPGEIVEAARVDGANSWQVFTQVLLPLSVPGLASLAIFQFMWVWNDLLVALVLMNDPGSQPMTVRIQALLGTYATEWDIMSSAAFISMAVPLAANTPGRGSPPSRRGFGCRSAQDPAPGPSGHRRCIGCGSSRTSLRERH